MKSRTSRCKRAGFVAPVVGAALLLAAFARIAGATARPMAGATCPMPGTTGSMAGAAASPIPEALTPRMAGGKPPSEAPGAEAPSGVPGVGASSMAPSIPQAAAGGKPWRIQGKLSEACTCSVPCTCNFGGAPSPEHYCHAIFSLDIEKGHYGDVMLNGLHLAAGNAAKGTVWYIDDRAAPGQAAALRDIANTINAKLVRYWKGVDPKIVEDPQFKQLGFKTAKIVQTVTDKGSLLKIGDVGRFESDFILGIDGKTPIVVENNWSWNIRHGIKGKTRQLKYEDEYGNLIDASATNSNQGRFDWNDKTPIYLR